MVRVCARERGDTFPPLSCFRFHLSRSLPPLFAEHQHHLLFARSIYSVNYICLCSRYTAVVLSSVNCAFTFPSPPLLLRSPLSSPLFIFFFMFATLFCLLVLLVPSYRSQFGIPRGLRLRLILRLALHARKARRPIGSVKLSPPVRSSRAVNFRFARLSSAFPLICRVRACRREITRSPAPIAGPARRHFSFQFYFAALFRTRENFTLHRLFNPLAELSQSRSSAVNSLLFAVTPPHFPRRFVKIKRACTQARKPRVFPV